MLAACGTEKADNSKTIADLERKKATVTNEMNLLNDSAKRVQERFDVLPIEVKAMNADSLFFIRKKATNLLRETAALDSAIKSLK